MAKISILRRSSYLYSFSKIPVLINQQVVDSLANGEKIVLNVGAGPCELRVGKNHFLQTPLVFDLKDDDLVECVVAFGFWDTFLALLKIPISLVLGNVIFASTDSFWFGLLCACLSGVMLSMLVRFPLRQIPHDSI